MKNHQSVYNTLTSVGQYLIWMQESYTDEGYQARQDALDIIRSAKSEVMKGNAREICVVTGFDYADKWESIYSYGESIKRQAKDAIRMAFGY